MESEDEEMQIPLPQQSQLINRHSNSSSGRRSGTVAFALEDEEIPESEFPSQLTFSSSGEQESAFDSPDEEAGIIPDRRTALQRSPSVRRQSVRNLRSSLVTDMSTGMLGGRAQVAQVRQSAKLAGASGDRKMIHLKNLFAVGEAEEKPAELSIPAVRPKKDGINFQSNQIKTYSVSSRRSGDSLGTNTEAPSDSMQYCLRALPPPSRNPKWMQWLGFGETRLTIYEARNTADGFAICGINPNKVVINFLHWTFRQTFVTMILVSVVFFFVLTILFAFAIWQAGRRHPECIGGVTYENHFFIDAFMLSWTTFSTVGYGLIYSGISTEVVDVKDCTGVTVLMAFESFVGILFASMCGAILFTKVARIQSFAQVTFSEPVCVRFGSGVKVEMEEGSDDGSQSTTDTDLDKLPCPILEFRVTNRLHSVAGGEIIDATMSVVAAIDAAQACPTVVKQGNPRRRRGGKKGKGRRTRAQARRTQTELHPNPNDVGAETLPDLPPPSVSDAVRPTQAFDEDPTGHLVPRRIISKLECESQDHPFFKRVWIVRHTLDHLSPLLRAHARYLVKKNRGFWPKELNSADGVRSAIHFDQLLISMSGTSNADANSVYAQKVYEFADVHVGYRFVNMLYRDENDGHLRVDTGLLNDVMEQAGGGGEVLEAVRANTLEMLVL